MNTHDNTEFIMKADMQKRQKRESNIIMRENHHNTKIIEIINNEIKGGRKKQNI